MSNEFKTWENLKDEGNGKISVTLDGKTVPLRYTVHQMQQLALIMEDGKDEKERTLEDIAEKDLEICEIALNPDPTETTFTKDQINQCLDLDQIKLFATYWLQKKVFSPTMDKFPQIGNQKN